MELEQPQQEFPTTIQSTSTTKSNVENNGENNSSSNQIQLDQEESSQSKTSMNLLENEEKIIEDELENVEMHSKEEKQEDEETMDLDQNQDQQQPPIPPIIPNFNETPSNRQSLMSQIRSVSLTRPTQPPRPPVIHMNPAPSTDLQSELKKTLRTKSKDAQKIDDFKEQIILPFKDRLSKFNFDSFPSLKKLYLDAQKIEKQMASDFPPYVVSTQLGWPESVIAGLRQLYLEIDSIEKVILSGQQAIKNNNPSKPMPPETISLHLKNVLDLENRFKSLERNAEYHAMSLTKRDSCIFLLNLAETSVVVPLLKLLFALAFDSCSKIESLSRSKFEKTTRIKQTWTHLRLALNFARSFRPQARPSQMLQESIEMLETLSAQYYDVLRNEKEFYEISEWLKSEQKKKSEQQPQQQSTGLKNSNSQINLKSSNNNLKTQDFLNSLLSLLALKSIETFSKFKSLISEMEQPKEWRDPKGNNLLHLCVESSQLECSKFCISQLSIDINSKNHFSETPLHVASRIGNLEILKFLASLENADFSIRDQFSKTALSNALFKFTPSKSTANSTTTTTPTSKPFGFDFSSYLCSQVLSDVEFLFPNNEIVHAHRIVLSVGSPTFKKMFEGNFVEKDKRQITLHEVDSKSFKLVLQYLYTGSVNIPSDNSAMEILKLANRFLLDNLRLFVESLLLQRLELENAFQYFFLSTKWQSSSLSHACASLILKEYPQLAFADADRSVLNSVLDFLSKQQ